MYENQQSWKFGSKIVSPMNESAYDEAFQTRSHFSRGLRLKYSLFKYFSINPQNMIITSEVELQFDVSQATSWKTLLRRIKRKSIFIPSYQTLIKKYQTQIGYYSSMSKWFMFVVSLYDATKYICCCCLAVFVYALKNFVKFNWSFISERTQRG